MQAAIPAFAARRLAPNLELFKWAGLLFMLIDHVNVYVLGDRYPIAEEFGAFAFPLFVLALASGLAHRRFDAERIGWLVERLFIWAVVAQFLSLLVRDFFPVNVLFTLALGTWAHMRWQGYGPTPKAALGNLVIVIAGLPCEFSTLGVLLVWFTLDAFRSERPADFLLPLLILPLLVIFNDGSHNAVWVLPLLVLASLLPRDLPRIRGFFYYAYALQFPVFWVAARSIG